MNQQQVRRTFSAIIDVARSRGDLMDHLSPNDRDSASIHGNVQGELSIDRIGSHSYPHFILSWQTDTMPRELQIGEPAPDSASHDLSELPLEQMLMIVFGERVEARERKASAIEHWRAILEQGQGLFMAFPIDQERFRALIRTTEARGQLFVQTVPDFDDYRVMWTVDLSARRQAPETALIDLTDLTVPSAVDEIAQYRLARR
jgi:hypothetical protein